jgi:hypothetical protein
MSTRVRPPAFRGRLIPIPYRVGDGQSKFHPSFSIVEAYDWLSLTNHSDQLVG